ncbi:MAG: phytoene/squalene synthase family protein [Candidatus Eremiobacteraeota bacterium]|nr:phytoene/squalene synthase family protein [Candidatus Eremiobacteraeota bacterium]
MHDLAQSERWCERTMRTHASSFYLSTRLLPAHKRRAIEALYGFCRFADDTADEPGPTTRQRRAAFTTIRRDLEAVAKSESAGMHPWFPALRLAFERFPLSLDDARLLVDGCESDLQTVNITSMQDLERYSSAVAGTVGRFTVCVLGARDEDSLRRATLLGIAMQMTNVLRDVAEDWKAGRNYLPSNAFSTQSAADVMRTVASVARYYYREADVLASRVPNDGSRLSIILARNMYQGILDRIDAGNYDWSRGRAVVPGREKLRLALRSVLNAYVGFSTIK